MTSLPNGLPISLRPVANSTTNASALPSLIARIHAERGSFRNLSEDSLRQEIAEAEAGKNEEEDESSSEGEEEEEEEEPDRKKELLTAKEEIVGQIEVAHNSAMIALDFISLLLSKDMPVQASLSISPLLREKAGMGTIGADKTQAPRVTEQQKQENKRIAKGWKASNLNKTVDSILASATRLEKEIGAETKYWEEVLAVSESGWAVCRLPQEKHTLGVRFGFAEAAPAFKNRSLAALRRNPNGSIFLDQGITSTQPQALRVRIESNGVITGETVLPKAVPEDAPVQDVILQARNTIFASELWQELHREARTLASHGVQTNSKDDTIICPLSPHKTIVIDLQPLPADPFRPILGARPDSFLATGFNLALHLFLSLAHRQNHRKRATPPPPISSVPRPRPAYHLLRSILTRLVYESSISSLNTTLTPLCTTLRISQVPFPPSYSITMSANPLMHLPATERIFTSFIDRLEWISILVLPYQNPNMTSATQITQTTLNIQTITLLPLSCPTFKLSLEPISSPLAEICPAPPVLADWEAVRDYIFWCVGCWLALRFSVDMPLSLQGGVGTSPMHGWKASTTGNVLRKTFEDGGIKQMTFEVVEKERVREVGKGVGEKEKEKRVVVRVEWVWITNGDEVSEKERKLNDGEGVYEWGFEGKGDGVEEVIRRMGEVVEEAGRR